MSFHLSSLSLLGFPYKLELILPANTLLYWVINYADMTFYYVSTKRVVKDIYELWVSLNISGTASFSRSSLFLLGVHASMSQTSILLYTCIELRVLSYSFSTTQIVVFEKLIIFHLEPMGLTCKQNLLPHNECHLL